MKNTLRPFLPIFLLIVIFCINENLRSQTIAEGFETGLPTSYESVPTDHILSSGTWTLLNVEQTTSNIHSGTYCAQIKQSGNPGAYAEAPAVNGVTTITFWVRGGKNVSSGLLVEKSVGGGAFTTIQAFDVTSTVTQYTCVVDDPSENIRIRFETGNLTTLYFDDVVINSSSAIIELSTNTLPDFGTIVGGTNSSSEKYYVVGSKLTDDIIVTAPTGFQVSTDDMNYYSTVTLTQTGGTVDSASGKVYVRFFPASADGTESGKISNSSGGMTKYISVTGTAVANEPDTQSSISFGTVTGNSIELNLSGGNGSSRIIIAHAGNNVTWTPNDGSNIESNNNFSIATDQGNGNKVVYNGSGSNVVVTGLSTGTTYYFASFEYNTGTNNSENYLTTNPGKGNQTTLKVPGLTISPVSLSFGSAVVGGSTIEKSFSLKGSYLSPASGNITIETPDGYLVSTSDSLNFSSSIQVAYADYTLDTTIYVQFLPSSITYYNDSLTISGGGAPSIYLNVNGKGISHEVLPDSTPFGFASCGTGTTGGEGGDTVYVTTAQQLDELITARQKNITTPIVIVISGTLTGLSNEVEVKYQGNETIIGAGKDAKLKGFGIKIWNAFNIIVRNLTFADCTAGEGDAVSIETCNNVWIDHNTFTDSPGSGLDESHDGQTDVKKGSYFVTISWNHYMNHRKTCLLGHTESLTSDTVMKVTYYRNWFDGTYSRHPRARFAKAHIINNLYSGVGELDGVTGGYGIGATCSCQLYVESNYFENTVTPTLISGVNDPSGVLSHDPPGYLKASGNYLVNSGSIVQDTDSFNFNPNDYYSYSALDAKQVKSVVMEGAGAGILDVKGVTGIAKTFGQKIPKTFSLQQNYPNPFNPSSKIQYAIGNRQFVSLIVYDILGREVAALVNEEKPAGKYEVEFSASNLPSGVYFYRLKAGSFVSIKKLVLLK